ncbi:hypothetical protein N9O08_01640 [Alphaproteobacteria bacterium]|nr:hypothetical protein [Alphaproteobacteria bacterium]
MSIIFKLVKLTGVAKGALPIVLGFVGSIIILNYFSSDSLSNKVNFNDLALGKNTSSYNALIDNHQVHCRDLIDAELCINGYKNKYSNSNYDIVLWLGNSQLHSINQMKPGEETAIPILHRKLIDLQKYLMAFSQPNANLQEHYVLLNFLVSKLPISTIVLPVVFDDMRETGIRKSINDALKNQFVANELKKTDIGKKILSNYNNEDHFGNEKDALGDTTQESFESFLDTKLGLYWHTWKERPSLRGKFFYEFLYQSRNWLFNINASSTRKVIPGRYISNMQALNEMLQLSREKKIKVLVYIVPIRNDVKIPYDLVQYKSFKEEVGSLSRKYKNVVFRDLGAIVPSELWGVKTSTTIGKDVELDFMHFQAGGHKILADSILLGLDLLWSQ